MAPAVDPATTYIDRDGKTYMSSPASMVDLVSIDPNTVSADYFV